MDANFTYPIRYGDRIFVTIRKGGITVKNLTLENVATLTDVLGEVRDAMGDTRGLYSTIIRNYHRGWSVDYPVMLYGRNRGPLSPRCQRLAEIRAKALEKRSGQKRMLMPWETH